jgi:hypothetical protein
MRRLNVSVGSLALQEIKVKIALLISMLSMNWCSFVDSSLFCPYMVSFPHMLLLYTRQSFAVLLNHVTKEENIWNKKNLNSQVIKFQSFLLTISATYITTCRWCVRGGLAHALAVVPAASLRGRLDSKAEHGGRRRSAAGQCGTWQRLHLDGWCVAATTSRSPWWDGEDRRADVAHDGGHAAQRRSRGGDEHNGWRTNSASRVGSSRP